MTSTQLASPPATVAASVLARLEAAWNAGDGAAFGAVYARDASFVTIRGDHLSGASAIGQGHAGIFATIYAGSINQMELVRSEAVAGGTVLAISRNTLTCPTGPLAGVHHAMSTNLIIPAGTDGWQVLATHNTLITTP